MKLNPFPSRAFLFAGASLVAVHSAARAQDTKIWIGDGITSDGTYDGTDEVPFQTALGLLGSGGQIEVLPGEYTFGSTLLVDEPGIRIYGSRGARIKPVQNLDFPLIKVADTGVGFVLQGVTLTEPRTNAQDLLRLEADDSTISGCAFRIMGGASATANVLSFGEATDGINGALVQGNSFLFDSEVAGRLGLRVEGTRGLRIFANEFRALDLSEASLIWGAVAIVDSPGATVEANTFAALTCPTDGEIDSALVACVQGDGPDGRLSFSGNVFSRVKASSIVHVQGDGMCSIQGNVFGRDAAPQGVVRLEGGTGNGVTGNQFNATGTNGGVCVLAQQGRAVTVSANTFLDATDAQIVLDGVVGAVLRGNRFTHKSGIMINITAIKLLSASADVLVVGNATRGAAWLQGFTPSTEVTAYGNLFP